MNVVVKWPELVLHIVGAPHSHLGVELGLLFLVVFLSPSRQVPVYYKFLRLVEVYFLRHVCMYVGTYICLYVYMYVCMRVSSFSVYCCQ